MVFPRTVLWRHSPQMTFLWAGITHCRKGKTGDSPEGNCERAGRMAEPFPRRENQVLKNLFTKSWVRLVMTLEKLSIHRTRVLSGLSRRETIGTFCTRGELATNRGGRRYLLRSVAMQVCEKRLKQLFDGVKMQSPTTGQ